MAVVRLEHSLSAPVKLVWEVITDPNVFSRRAPILSNVEIVEGRGVGMRRCCHDVRGRFWFEHCTAWDEGRSYTMETDVDEFPYPFKEMKGTWGLKDLGNDKVLIFIQYEYTPKFGHLGHVLDWFYYKWKIEHYCKKLMESMEDEVGVREAKYHLTVKKILSGKGFEVVNITPDVTLERASQILTENRIGAVLVMEGGEHLVGLVSERDIVRCIAKHDEPVRKWPVEKLMVRKLHVCSMDTDIDELMNIMTERRVRHLPVLEGDKVVGIVSIGDVVKARMSELAYASESLRIYIAARKWREEHKYVPVGGV